MSGLESEIKHMKKLHEIELKDLRTTFQDELHKEKRALEREGDVANSAQQLALKRMRNELYDKNQEINSLSKKMANNENMHSAEMEHLKREK